MAVTITQGTTTGIATDLVGTNHYQTVKLDIGTAGVSNPFAGTLPSVTNLAGGTITSLAAGTVNTLGTVGSVTNLGSVTNIGSIASGVLTSLGTIPGVGTITNLGSITNIGSIAAGVITSLTTVSNLTNGSINILTGTIQSSGTTTGVGVVSNITNGSINILTGTIQSSGTTTGVGVVSNLTNGSVNLLTGTVTSVTNLAGGTVKIDPVPVPATLAYGTLGTAGGSMFGTLSSASGAGTKHYVTGVDIVMQSGTADVRVLCGTVIQGTGVLVAGQFVPSGGISKQINPAFVSGTNSELTYHFVGAGTAFITINYWKGT